MPHIGARAAWLHSHRARVQHRLGRLYEQRLKFHVRRVVRHYRAGQNAAGHHSLQELNRPDCEPQGFGAASVIRRQPQICPIVWTQDGTEMLLGRLGRQGE